MPSFIRMGLVLMMVGAVATAILAATYEVTKEPIAEAKRQEILKALRQVLPTGFTNQPDQDVINLTGERLNRDKTPVIFYRSRRDGVATGAAYMVTAPDGYSGNIEIMMGVTPESVVNGIQVIAHAETPGLGDKIAGDKKDRLVWRGFFVGKTLDNVKWGVKKDNGDFDQFAGATITPRAVVKAVKKGLEFFVDNKDKIFAETTPVETTPAETTPAENTP